MKIIFEFAGGSRDGQTDVSDAGELYKEGVSSDLAISHYKMTEDGTVGRQFWVATTHAINLIHKLPHDDLTTSQEARSETYEVTERLEDTKTGEIRVRCKFIGYQE